MCERESVHVSMYMYVCMYVSMYMYVCMCELEVYMSVKGCTCYQNNIAME